MICVAGLLTTGIIGTAGFATVFLPFSHSVERDPVSFSSQGVEMPICGF